MTIENSIEFLRSPSSDSFPGIYRGVVESIDDPDRLSRLRTRVWAVHGDPSITPTKSLPWAETSFEGGGGYDFGPTDLPPVGSSVWIMFEQADPDYPVVIGTFRGVPKRDENNPNVFLINDSEPATENGWQPPDEELETPKDVFEDVYSGDPHPTRRIWKKSYKGHTIIIEDGDGKEFLKIIDRSGQIIEMDCPVEVSSSEGNQAQRGTRDSTKNNQLSHDILVNKRASIRIKDLSGQEILLDAQNMRERIVLRSRNRAGTIENKIELRSGKGKESIEIVDSAGDSIKMDPNSQTPIEISDSSGNSIVFDKENGKITLNSTKISEETAPNKSSIIKGNKTSDIRGEEAKSILGNKRTRVVGDINFGSLGSSFGSIGGALKLLIANQAPSGSESNAIDIKVNNVTGGGDIKVSTLFGDFVIGSDKGNVELSTLIGNAVLKTLSAGNANVDSTTGKVILGSSSLPEAIGSLEKLVKGDTHNQLLSTYLSSLNSAVTALSGAMVTFNAVLTAAIPSLATPVTGPSLFLGAVATPWLTFQQTFATSVSSILTAITTLSSSLVTMLSIKTVTQ